MSRFAELIDSSVNHLPYAGKVHYWGSIFPGERSRMYREQLLEKIEWRHDEAIIFGKHIITKRKVAWHASQPYEYTYSGIHRSARPWTPLLLELKAAVESHTGQEYNSCLLNLYHDGQEGMAWHSDDEKDLRQDGSIASLSFGAKRKFALKHRKTKHKVVFELECGDLLEMKDETQTHWMHSLPTTKRVFAPRINLTFRQMRE